MAQVLASDSDPGASDNQSEERVEVSGHNRCLVDPTDSITSSCWGSFYGFGWGRVLVLLNILVCRDIIFYCSLNLLALCLRIVILCGGAEEQRQRYKDIFFIPCCNETQVHCPILCHCIQEARTDNNGCFIIFSNKSPNCIITELYDWVVQRKKEESSQYCVETQHHFSWHHVVGTTWTNFQGQ